MDNSSIKNQSLKYIVEIVFNCILLIINQISIWGKQNPMIKYKNNSECEKDGQN